MKAPNYYSYASAPQFISQPPGKLALLVECVGKRRRSSPKEFTNAHAALDWCEREQITFIYLPAPDHSKN